MLTFNLKKQWFDKIKNGEKTHEYREVTDYWTSRFENLLQIDYLTLGKKLCQERICFCLGYPSKNDKSKRIYAVMRSLSIINGKTTDLAIDKPVYNIEFEVIKWQKKISQAEVWFKKACKYKSALEEIEEVITPTSLISGKDLSADKVAQIQEIINNKVKDE